MTREEAIIDISIKALKQDPCGDCISRQAVLDKPKACTDCKCGECWKCCTSEGKGGKGITYKENIKAILECYFTGFKEEIIDSACNRILEQEPKTGHCRECKYFEYDSLAKVNGIPLIVAHEICSRWGDGCKTTEDGYCFLYEPAERSGKE